MSDLELEVAAALQLARACDDLTTRMLQASTSEEFVALRATALEIYEDLHNHLDTAFGELNRHVERLERDHGAHS